MPDSKITHDGPTMGLIAHWIGCLWMRLTGWKITGQIPPGGRFVLIGAPHTSNWDFFFGLATLYVIRLKVSWMGKDALFRKPFGGVMRWLGGIAIDRDSPHDVVEQMVEKFTSRRQLVLLITPSATRRKTDYWKSGFYWIARAAKVPILCGYLDYKKKEACFGFTFIPADSIRDDMDRIREFYKGAQGKRPELTTTVRLRDEDAS